MVGLDYCCAMNTNQSHNWTQTTLKGILSYRREGLVNNVKEQKILGNPNNVIQNNRCLRGKKVLLVISSWVEHISEISKYVKMLYS